MKFKNYFLFFISISLFISCGSPKEVETPLPTWIQQKPIDEAYFYGIGKSNKFGDATRYIAKARREALNDLAQEVSVNISSKSVLYKFENEAGISEYYQDRIKTSSQEYLEGFTPIDSHENQTSYWTLYKIKKTTYYKIKEERKRKSLSDAYNLYLEGKNEEKSNAYIKALKNYILAFEGIKYYLGDDTTFDLEGNEFDISKEIMLAIQECLNNMKLHIVHSNVQRNRGDQIELNTHYFTLKNKAGKILKEYPIILNSKALEVYDFAFQTNEKGSSTYEVILNSTNSSEKLEIALNWKNIVNSTTKDLLIRKILSSIKYPKETINFKIVQPSISLKSKYSSSLNKKIEESIVAYFGKKKIKESSNSKNLYRINYSVKEKKSRENIVFEIVYSVKQKSKIILEKTFRKDFDNNMYGTYSSEELWKKVKNEFERKHLNSIYKKITQQ
ncbi:LPP20 family lipoprotein [Aureivirga marina]|uniref:LPP20 family lipoprotein n=1 Tax=Aureivirga marina TaxID=1182451 RepID=UPI0018CB0711|nr:LPP20 family lipoprotein [Aureivirga marina]